MAGVINIGADNASDQFYRYKMPKLQARVWQCFLLLCSPISGNLHVAALDLYCVRADPCSDLSCNGLMTGRLRPEWKDRPPCGFWDAEAAVVALQIEGRGNGIKTNVVNNVEVAKALERPPDCTCFLLCCWASPTSAIAN